MKKNSNPAVAEPKLSGPNTPTAPSPGNEKYDSMEPARAHPGGTFLTTDQGIPIAHTDDSLKAGVRGPTLLEDFHFREKLTRFDHERIPERVVHARGSAAHGYFQVYESLSEFTRAKFLCDPTKKTPVFVRFSTVVGSRGSADTVRDVRGFATRFYTEEGNFDLVGNNIPVFFIQDGIKFPDIVHALKPEPHHEMPQASSAHDSFWDFVSLVPETAHMVMWVMSDRAIPRSYRMMEGFGVHTFRLVNEQGRSHLVKFHWKPVLGTHSLVWDEAQKIAGKDPDFHRRDLWEAIQNGDYPEFELGLQIIDESDELSFGFDLLDATKLLPEELVPVRRVGKLTLTRNPDNFFAETEQVAFHLGNTVAGIDFTNDPLLQARLFSYLDTQLLRLGGPNFTEIPINRPIAPVFNHQQDGFMRQTVVTSRANYHPNSLGGGCPFLASQEQGAFVHYPQRVEGIKTRERSPTFNDHFSQATMFFNSLSAAEREHLILACRFEVGKVERREVRERVIELFAKIDPYLASAVAQGVGASRPDAKNRSAEIDGLPSGTGGAPPPSPTIVISPALSQDNTAKNSIRSRVIAILACDGAAGDVLKAVRDALLHAGARVHLVSVDLDPLESRQAEAIPVDKTFLTSGSVLYDAVFVPGGASSITALKQQGDAIHFINEAFKHCKAIGAFGEGVDLLQEANLFGISLPDATLEGTVAELGVVSARAIGALDEFIQQFIAAIAQHRHWNRTTKESVPA